MAGEYGTYDYIYVFDRTNIFDPTVASAATLALEVAAADTTFVWVAPWPMQVLAFGYMVTVAFDYNVQVAQGVVALDKRVTFGSNTGRVEVARLELLDGLAISAVRFILPNRTNILLDPGDSLVCEVVVAATGGGAIAGDWVPFVMCGVRSETPANITGWTQSALAQVV